MHNNNILQQITHDKFLKHFRFFIKSNGNRKLTTMQNLVTSKENKDNSGPFVKSSVFSAFFDKYSPYDSEKLSEIAKDMTLTINIL